MAGTQIVNCTPHVIRIFSKDDTRYDKYLRKRFLIRKDAKPLVEIPTSGIVLSVSKRLNKIGEVNGIPICELVPQLPDNLSNLLKLEEGTLLVVSTLFAIACQQAKLEVFKNRLLTVGSPVYLEEKLVGCLCLVNTY